MVSEVDRRTEVGKRQIIYKRNYRRARDRALTRLANAHKQEYLLLLEREKAKDEEMGKRWLDIAGTTDSNRAIESHKDAIEGAVDPDTSGYDGANPGYNGGEK